MKQETMSINQMRRNDNLFNDFIKQNNFKYIDCNFYVLPHKKKLFKFIKIPNKGMITIATTNNDCNVDILYIRYNHGLRLAFKCSIWKYTGIV